MVSLYQIKKVRTLVEQDYVLIENPVYEGLDRIHIPVSGPSTLRAPNGDLVQIFEDGKERMFIKNNAGVA